MSISASMVKELRERTGAGMMECKKALVEADGDLDAAAEILRKTGQAKADKKASRVAADGRIVIAQEGNTAVMVEVNSETDFVAKDENFVAFTDAVAAAALASGTTDVAAFSNEALADGRTVEQARTDLIAKVGENIGVRRIQVVNSGSVLASYSHGARIGTVVALDGGDEDLARDVAMHVAAMNPQYVAESDVPADTLENERRILTEQAQDSGKPADIIEKMVAGRVNKFLKEITLLGQPFVKDDSLTVGKLLSNAGASITACVRFEVGEGIEKKQENFVEEVMAQVKGAS
ncbi:MAG: elongation factor Ts [Woeseiaceae bacterium]|nr:elongation factor Ts [Woeseiaceae bacterium]NIP19725.1 elongation factor Ts [Woeseiaceae bacterium]NIS89842.1 elongation factor Ts [Woeseiaceae bacterium]